jgi:hypothetical protein
LEWDFEFACRLVVLGGDGEIDGGWVLNDVAVRL